MGAEITLQALNGELREFFLGASGMDHLFVVQLAELFEETDCAIRRVISENGKAHAFPVGFELFVFVITGFPNLERELTESAYDAEFQIASYRSLPLRRTRANRSPIACVVATGAGASRVSATTSSFFSMEGATGVGVTE